MGGVIARMLRARGDEVRTVARHDYPALTALGCTHVKGDLSQAAVARQAVEGVEAIIHVAAKAGIWGRAAEYEASNITATQHLLDAAAQYGARRFVYTSSSSVTFDGSDAVHANESSPYPTRYLAHYPRTKAEAERRVLAANGRRDLVTCALRPPLIFGPGDPHFLPRFVQRAKAGRLAWVGAGNEVDVTYVDNAAHAHLLALDALAGPAPKPAGKAYFISQGTPVKTEAWVGELLADLGVRPVTRRVKLPVAYAVGAVLEAVWWLFGLAGEPAITRMIAAQLGTSHHYDLTAARADFGYQLLVSDADARRRTIEWLREELAAGRL